MKALGIATTIFEVLVLVSFAIGQTTSPTLIPNRDAGAEDQTRKLEIVSVSQRGWAAYR
jgi:hypothetical protein